MKQFFAFTLQHTVDGDASPTANYLGYVVFGYFLFDHSLSFLALLQLLLYVLVILFKHLQLAVAYLGHFSVVSLALSTLGLEA